VNYDKTHDIRAKQAQLAKLQEKWAKLNSKTSQNVYRNTDGDQKRKEEK